MEDKTTILSLKVNDQARKTLIQPNQTLMEVLRENLDLKGTKCGCDTGECGLCAVLVDGKPVLSCLTLGALCEGKEVSTIEGLQGEAYEALHQAFVEEGAVQCGFCTPSMVLVLNWILEKKPEKDVKKILSGHLCRCTGYVKILKAFERAKETLSEAGLKTD